MTDKEKFEQLMREFGVSLTKTCNYARNERGTRASYDVFEIEGGYGQGSNYVPVICFDCVGKFITFGSIV